jgi:hypothetical protein
VEGLFIHVAVNRVINLDHRSERALPEASDRSQREAPVGRCQGELVCLVLVVLLVDSQFKPEPFEQAA